MRVDVSEIKSFKACPRQWKLSSRNGYHLRPRVTPPQLALGTLFHEALHSLYLGASLETVMGNVRKEMSMESDGALLAMIPGYAKEVLPEDLDKYVVLDIEHKFSMNAGKLYTRVTGFSGEDIKDVELCGSIDMIVLCPEDNCIYGFEHKTAKNFRPTSYLWMDEQPRLYYLALQEYVEEYNIKHRKDEGFVPVKVGGIFLNEVKKLLRQFQYNRTLCTYEDDDLKHFLYTFCKKVRDVHQMVQQGYYACPEPDYFKCQMCDFKEVCETYMYSDIPKALLLDDWKDQFVEREEDHLDEKVERNKNNDI